MRVALLGAGYMGRLHAEKLAALPDVRIVAVADPDRSRADALAARLGCRASASVSEAIADADAAVIAAPTRLHAVLGAACLEAGLHVLVEKPLASSLPEADALVALAARMHRVLQVGHVERCNPAFCALAKRLSAPLYIDAERLCCFTSRGTDVDVVMDLMIHDLDLALALAGAEIAGASACGFRVLTDRIDIANARIEFRNGCVASLSASRVSQSPVRKLRVFEGGQYVSADLRTGRLRCVHRRDGRIEEREERHEPGDPLAVQARAFVAAIGEGKAVPVDGAAARCALSLALQVGELARERLQRFA